MPKVSIVLPVYNGEKYIKESIDSIIGQKFSDWELLIIDDCSSDRTPNIISHYEEQDKRIRVIRNDKNERLPKSLNIGFRNAVGEFLTWTSDDNVFLPDALSKMVEILDENRHSGMVCCNMYLIDDIGNIIGEKKVGANDLCVSNCIGACFLYRKSIMEKIGEYDTSLFLVEDYDYWIRIEKECRSILYCEEFLYKYRKHTESLSEKRIAQVNEARAKFREKHKDYIIEKLKDSPKELFAILYENCKCGQKSLGINVEIVKKYKQFTPLLNELTEADTVVVFGAGEYGRRFIEETNKKILFFVDNNTEKINTTIDKYVVKAIDSLKRLDDDVYIVVAVSCKNMMDILVQLQLMGCSRIIITY